MVYSIKENLSAFPEEVILYLKHVLDEFIEPVDEFWLEFEKKVLFSKDKKYGALEFKYAAEGTK